MIYKAYKIIKELAKKDIELNEMFIVASDENIIVYALNTMSMVKSSGFVHDPMFWETIEYAKKYNESLFRRALSLTVSELLTTDNYLQRLYKKRTAIKGDKINTSSGITNALNVIDVFMEAQGMAFERETKKEVKQIRKDAQNLELSREDIITLQEKIQKELCSQIHLHPKELLLPPDDPLIQQRKEHMCVNSKRRDSLEFAINLDKKIERKLKTVY